MGAVVGLSVLSAPSRGELVAEQQKKADAVSGWCLACTGAGNIKIYDSFILGRHAAVSYTCKEDMVNDRNKTLCWRLFGLVCLCVGVFSVRGLSFVVGVAFGGSLYLDVCICDTR